MRTATPTSRRRSLGPVARAVGAASFFADVCQGIAAALLPRFVTGALGAPASVLGVIEGLSDGAGGMARLVGGAVSGDTQRRRVAAVGGYAATAMSLSALSVAPGPAVAGALRVAGVASFNFRIPARNSVLAGAVPAASIGRAFGFERAMAATGAIVGPLLAIWLLRSLGVRGALGAALLPGLAATAAIFWAVRRGPARPRRFPLVHLPVRRLLRTRLRRLLGVLAPFELGRVGSSFLLLRATEVLGPSRGGSGATEAALVLFAVHNALGALVAAPAGRFCDRVGPRSALVVGIMAMCTGVALLAAPGAEVGLLVAGFLVTGVGDGVLQPAVPAAVARSVPGDLRAAAFGLTSGLQGVANLVAGAAIGLVWTVASPEAALGMAAGWMAASLGLLARTQRNGP